MVILFKVEEELLVDIALEVVEIVFVDAGVLMNLVLFEDLGASLKVLVSLCVFRVRLMFTFLADVERVNEDSRYLSLFCAFSTKLPHLGPDVLGRVADVFAIECLEVATF